MRKISLLLLTLAAVLMTSCEVEFSPNEDWQDIPVVYCVLDQDDDTTYVRLQRCFLGEGNHYQYASEADSNVYGAGAVTVLMEEWAAEKDADGLYHRTGDAPRRVFNFDYSESTDKEDGLFFRAGQPIYKCETRRQLDTNCVYCLKVVKRSTGDTIARAETSLIGGQMRLSQPNNVTLFQFSGSAGSKTCRLEWSALQTARQYQPIVRFYYRDFIIDRSVLPWDTTITPHYIDIPCNVVRSNMRDRLYSTTLDQNTFLKTIKETIGEEDTCNKNVIDTVEIFVTCCNEPLAQYMYAVNPSNSLNQDPFTYTNIDGGLGVFASRRRHLSFRVGTPVSSVSDYIKKLKELGVGF